MAPAVVANDPVKVRPPFKVARPATVRVLVPVMVNGAAKVISGVAGLNVAMMDAASPLVALTVVTPAALIPPVFAPLYVPSAVITIPPEVVPATSDTNPTVPPLTDIPVDDPDVVPAELMVIVPLVVPLVME